MKKGTKLVALLLGLALMVPACTPGANPSKSSVEPGTSSEAPVNYKVTISNKEELQAEWFVGDQSRKVNLEVEPKANITQLVNEGKIKITSSDPAKLAIEGQMASPVAAGEVTITVKCGESEDTVALTLKAKQTVQEKYGVQHAGTEADPFTNEEACKVAKAENYNNEDFYVKGKVASFYHLPGSRTDGAVSFYLEPATAGGEQFEVYKCYKSTGSGAESYLTDDDIWVGGTALAHGTFTTYGDQAETTGAKLVSCEGNKPQPRQTLEKTFAEVLAIGNALADGDAAWDYYKFQAYVTEMEGDNFFLTASKGEALIPGKSDAAHQEKDIKGTNAIELYNAGKNADVKAKLTKNAKIEVTMIVKNYHGTIENGLDIAAENVTVLEAGEPWVINYQEKTTAEALAIVNALEDGATAEGYYAVSGVVVAVTGAYSAQYGNMSFTIADKADDANVLTVFRYATDAETAAKIVAGLQVVAKGQLQKYKDKNNNITPELINVKEVVFDQSGGGTGGGGTGGDTGENLAEAVVLNYTGLTGKGTEIKTDADSLTKIGQGNAHVTAVTSSKIYDGNGTGGAYANSAGFLKTGTGSAAGQIVLTLDGKASKVEIKCHDWYKKSEAYPTNSNNVAVNGSADQLAPYNEEGTFEYLTFELASASNTITIDAKNRIFITEIKIS